MTLNHNKLNSDLPMFNQIVFLFEGTTHFSYEIRYTQHITVYITVVCRFGDFRKQTSNCLTSVVSLTGFWTKSWAVSTRRFVYKSDFYH